MTPENREKLFSEWAGFWDLSREVLLEKSPRHSTMTRFLQAMFGAERSAFLLVLRHPFGAAHHLWNAGTGFTADCGARFIVHWLKIHQALLDDAKFLKSITVVQYEHFMQGDTQGVFNSVEAQLGLSPSVSLVAVDTSEANNAVQKPWIQRRHRRLLELHGSRSNITVIKGVGVPVGGELQHVRGSKRPDVPGGV